MNKENNILYFNSMETSNWYNFENGKVSFRLWRVGTILIESKKLKTTLIKDHIHYYEMNKKDAYITDDAIDIFKQVINRGQND